MSLLITDYPMQLSPKLAQRIGDREALFIQQLHYLCERFGNKRDGKLWVYYSHREWAEKVFPFWSSKQVERIIANLKKFNLLVIGNFNRMGSDRTTWYRVNYAADVLNFTPAEEAEIAAQEDLDEIAHSSESADHFPKSGDHFPKSGDAFPEIGRPIPTDFHNRHSQQTFIDCAPLSGDAPPCDFADDVSDGLVGNLPAETVKAETVQTVLPADTPKPANHTAANRATWEAYRAAYLHRYGVEPLRNAKVNGQIAQFVRTVGVQDAPKLAAFYPWHNGGFFVQRRHDFGLLLQSAQQIRTDWLRGEQMTATAARQAEKTQANLESHKGALEILKNKGVI